MKHLWATDLERLRAINAAVGARSAALNDQQRILEAYDHCLKKRKRMLDDKTTELEKYDRYLEETEQNLHHETVKLDEAQWKHHTAVCRMKLDETAVCHAVVGQTPDTAHVA